MQQLKDTISNELFEEFYEGDDITARMNDSLMQQEDAKLIKREFFSSQSEFLNAKNKAYKANKRFNKAKNKLK